MVRPYLPGIIEDVVSKVDEYFFGRGTDPFHVFFDKGIIQQVRRSVNKNPDNFPLIWFVMRFEEDFTNPMIAGKFSFQTIIAVPTDNNYTQTEREENSYNPRLLPIYERYLLELKNSNAFTTPPGEIAHKRILMPYWGVGDVDGPDADNLFKNKFLDAMSISIPEIKVRRNWNC